MKKTKEQEIILKDIYRLEFPKDDKEFIREELLKSGMTNSEIDEMIDDLELVSEGAYDDGYDNPISKVSIVRRNSQKIKPPPPPPPPPLRGTKIIIQKGNSKTEIVETTDISSEEIAIAISDYMAPKKTLEDEKIAIRVTKKYKNKLKTWLIIASAATMLLAGVKTNEVNSEIKKLETEIEHQVIAENPEEDYEKKLDEILGKVSMSEELTVEEGQTFNTNSLLTGVNKTIGKEFDAENKTSGNYAVTGFSIVQNGQIIDYIENFDNKDLGDLSLLDYAEKVIKDNGLNMSDISIRLHLGSNGDYTRLGWIDLTDLINQKDITNEVIKNVTIEKRIVDYTEDLETIELGNGATIKIKDENGNLLKPGSKVIGTDGNEYTINEISIKQEENNQDNKIKVSYDITNPAILLGLAPLLAAILSEKKVKEKNEEAQKEPSLYEFRTSKQYSEFVKDFRERQEKYKKNSPFSKKLKETFFRSEIDVLQKYSKEDLLKIYSIIKSHANVDFVLGEEDQIKFQNGKIYIYYKNGGIQNITDIVLDEIALIGKENPIEAEGRIPDEDRNSGKKK